MAPRIAGANVAEREVGAEVHEHLGDQRGRLLEVDGNDDAIGFRHEAGDGVRFGLHDEGALGYRGEVDDGPRERDVEVRGEVGMQLGQRLARAPREHVVLLPPASLGRAGLRRRREASDPQGCRALGSWGGAPHGVTERAADWLGVTVQLPRVPGERMLAHKGALLEPTAPDCEPDERVRGVESDALSGRRECEYGHGSDDVRVGLQP
jgi:hypothetical protein